jgi:hypothetical protein
MTLVGAPLSSREPSEMSPHKRGFWKIGHPLSQGLPIRARYTHGIAAWGVRLLRGRSLVPTKG